MIKFLQKLKQVYIFDLPLMYKLVISHLILILLPTIVISVLIYTKLYGSIVSETVLTEQNTASEATIAIDDAISTLREATTTLVDSRAGTRLIYVDYYSPETVILSSWCEEFNETRQNLIDGTLITDIQIYVDEERSHLMDFDGFNDVASISSTYWYGIFSAQDVDSILCSSMYLSVTEEETRGDLAYISRIEAGEANLYIAVYFSSQEISSLMNNYINTKNSASYIIDDRDAIVVSSDSSLSGAYYMSNATLSDLSDGISKYTTSSYLGDNIYVGYFSIPDTSWHLVTILSSDSLQKKAQSLLAQFIAIYAVFFVLALLMAIAISRSIARRITGLSRQMSHTHGKKPSRIEAQPSRDEIGALLNTYNLMSDEINDLLNQQLATAEELKLKEFKALQSQINPHFLYNTLDMVKWQAQSGESQKASESIQALSKFYKLTLNRKNESGTVGEELEHISLYIQLQNMRYEDRINFMVDVDESLTDIAIPKLTLQPIVENCIQHGIMERPEKSGTILLTGWLEGEDLVLLVSDDGVGMSKEKLASILSGEGESKRGSNIGIYNTHARLQVLYGEGYGLSYESTPGEGTSTQIRVPAEVRGE